jgi:predicted porin
MTRLRASTLRLAPAALLFAALMSPSRANADVTLFDRDGWTFYTNGLIASHYQLVKGDPDPPLINSRVLVGGQILDEQVSSNQMNHTLTMSDIRSGFVGTQIGFGVNHQISQTLRVESLLAISVGGINSNRGQDLAFNKQGDYREAWAQIVGSWGTLKFGRMFGMFGEGSAEVQMMAWHYGVGHPCVVNHSTIACGSSGAGPIYPGFDGAIRYISPRLAGLQVAVSIVDPSVGTTLKYSPFPRVDSEASYDQTFGGVHVRIIGQGMLDPIGTSTVPNGMPGDANYMPGTLTMKNVWGVMGTGIVSVGGLTLGGGGWQGKGVGERIPLEAADAGNPIFQDTAGGLREFRGFYGNGRFQLGGHSLTAGGGILFVNPTPFDVATPSNSPLKQQYEFHAVYNYQFDSIILNVEAMRWQSEWSQGEKQALNFMGAGINYVW